MNPYCPCLVRQEVYTLVDVFVESNDPLQILKSAVSVIILQIGMRYLRVRSSRLRLLHPSEWGPSLGRIPLLRTCPAVASASSAVVAACTADLRFRRTVGKITPLPLSCKMNLNSVIKIRTVLNTLSILKRFFNQKSN